MGVAMPPHYTREGGNGECGNLGKALPGLWPLRAKNIICAGHAPRSGENCDRGNARGRLTNRKKNQKLAQCLAHCC
jgi:hypothetical protein